MQAKVIFAVLVLVCTSVAQKSPVTTLCAPAILWDGSGGSLGPYKVRYFQATVNDIAAFEFRLVARDGKPLGWVELYDYDADDETGINYDCFVAETADINACENVYVAGGDIAPNFENRVIKFGFQKCPQWSQTTHSLDMSLELYYRPTAGNMATLPTCTGFMEVSPTSYCLRSGASLLSVVVPTVIVGVMFLLSGATL